MAGFKYSQPAQIVHVLESSPGNSINSIVSDGLSIELGRTGVCDCVGRVETSEPIANPVGVTGPDENLNA